jgi:carbon-monoxide dehydrogenase medium subunit
MRGPQAAAPRDLAGLAAAVASAGGPICFIAGGTDLLVAPREVPAEGWVIDVSRTKGLAEIAAGDGMLRIGAAATLAELIRSPIIRQEMPVLAQAADQCGSAQIRNRATVGGNVANAAPASDLLPILKCCAARFEIRARDGTLLQRNFDDLVLGPGRTSLGCGDLIVSIEFPLEERLDRAAFVKLGPRDDLTIARLNMVMEADFDGGSRRFGEVRLVAGAIGPVPRPLPEVASVLRGRSLTPGLAQDFLGSLAAAVDMAIPGRASLAYKRRAAMGVGADLLEKITGIGELAP